MTLLGFLGQRSWQLGMRSLRRRPHCPHQQDAATGFIEQCAGVGIRRARRGSSEDRFEAFRRSVSLPHLLATAADVLRASAVPASFRDETLAQLAKSQRSESRQQLIFNYKLAFEAMGTSRRTWLP
jgi:hypothetical protein